MQRLPHRVNVSRAIEYHLGAIRVLAANRGDNWLLGRIDHPRGTERFRSLTPALLWVDHDHLARPLHPHQLQHDRSHRARTEDDNAVSGNDASEIDAAQTTRHRFRQRRVRQRQTLRNLERLRHRHHAKLGEASGYVDAERHKVLAEVSFSPPAEITHATKNVRVDRNVVSGHESIDAVSHGFHHPCVFVPGNQRQVRRIESVQNMRVRPADPRGRHAQKQSMRTNLGFSSVDEAEFSDLRYL